MSIKIFAFVAGLAAASAALAQPAQLEVNNAWARATPGKAETGAAYVTIQSPTADRLVSASSPVAKKAELHTMSMEGTVMKMRPIAGLDVPPGQPVSLKPGGEHIMLMGLNQALHEGQSFALTLDFEKAGPRTVTVTVEKAGSNGPAQR
ncbi:MAG: copper chaperone PCu(A)C [Alphaproteobacteria bacterium]|nr:copper chaperone PCu(A)C [Alphaproteobacteria bacterium]